MGGSGGTYNPSISRTGKNSNNVFQKSEDKAQRKLTEYQQRNVFISFDMSDHGMVRIISSQAKDERFSHDFRDYSVKEPFTSQWKTNVKKRISHTSAVIVAIGKNTHRSKAVNWEIDEAHRQRKKVIGIRLYKNKHHIVPESMRRNHDKVTNWDTKRIAKELE